MPPGPPSLVPLDAPLGILGKRLLGGVLTLGKGMGVAAPEIDLKQRITGAKALEIGHEVLGDLFPALKD